MKKIIVTGCNGQLGRAVNEIYKGSSEYELVNTDFNIEGIRSLDITNLEAVLELFEEVKPYAVINCAAHTAVDLCEVQKDLAYKINAIGPRNLSIAATKTGAKIIHISTDYVFPGDRADNVSIEASKKCANCDKADGSEKDGDISEEIPAYTEFDAPAPKAMYGKTKLAGEEFVKQFAKEWFIIRTAWLYGDGKNFVKTMLRLSETHDEITVVDDQIGSPTSAKELAKAVAYLLPTEKYGLYHGTCEGRCSWADFTKEIFRLAGKTTRVIPVTSGQYKEKNPNSADRPKFSVLENYMFKLTTDFMFSDWKTAIAEYMNSI